MKNEAVNNFKFMQVALISEYLPQIFAGTETHNSTLAYVGQLARCTRDEEKLLRTVTSCFPSDYSGDTIPSIPEMIKGAFEKGFGEDDFMGVKNKKMKTSEAVLAVLEEMTGIELFQDKLRNPYISSIAEGKGPCVYSLKSKSASLFIRGAYYKKSGKAISRADYEEVVGILTARANFEGKTRSVTSRIAAVEGGLLINLDDHDHQAVLIDKSGFRVTRDYPAMLMHTEGMMPLPVPTSDTGDIWKEFQEFLNLNDANFYRLCAFLINSIQATGPFSCLLIEGEQGSGKSFLCSIIKSLIDPSVVPRLRVPDTERDLMIMANSIYLPVFDNISSIRSKMSDAFCNLSSGGGFAARELYTDDGLKVFVGARPYILNGITGVANRPDLLERAILLKLEAMPAGRRKTEARMWKEFEVLRPRILGKLYEAIACALRDSDILEAPTILRMADSAKWIAAAEPAMGLPAGTLLKSLEASQQELVVDRMADNSIARYFSNLLKEGPYFGRVGDLHDHILRDDTLRHDRSIPSTSMHFSKELDRLRPALERVGIIVEFDKKDRDGRHLTIRLAEHGPEKVEHARRTYERMRNAF